MTNKKQKIYYIYDQVSPDLNDFLKEFSIEKNGKHYINLSAIEKELVRLQKEMERLQGENQDLKQKMKTIETPNKKIN